MVPGDNGEEEELLLPGGKLIRFATLTAQASPNGQQHHLVHQLGAKQASEADSKLQDQVQLRMRSHGSRWRRRRRRLDGKIEMENLSPLQATEMGDKFMGFRGKKGASKTRQLVDGSTTMSNEVAVQHKQTGAAREGRFAGGELGGESERTFRAALYSEGQIARQTRAKRLKLGAGVAMWPTWRQFVLFCLVSVFLTSLLANFNIILPKTSACLLNQCHALSVGPTLSSSTPVPPRSVGILIGSSTSSPSSQLLPFSTSTTLAPKSGLQLATTSATTASMGAPTAPPVSTQSSARSSMQTSQTQHLLALDGNSNESSKSNQAHSKHLQHQSKPQVNQKYQAAKQTQSNNLDNYPFVHQENPIQNNNKPELLADNNQRSAASGGDDLTIGNNIDSNGINNNRTFYPLLPTLNQAPTSQRVASSITSESRVFDQRQQQPQQRQSASVELPTIVVGRRLSSNYDHLASPPQQQALAPPATNATSVPTKSSTNGAIKLIAGPTLSLNPTQSPNSTNNLDANQAASDGWTLYSGVSTNESSGPGILSANGTQLANQAAQVGAGSGYERARGPLVARVSDSKRAETIRRQFLPTPQNLLQNAFRDAINDLMSSNPNEQIFSSASATRPLILRPHAIISALTASASSENQAQQPNPLLNFPNNQYQDYLLDGNQLIRAHLGQQRSKPMLHTASASAPSISLPPLSHFLSPRNPFRLFSSSSSPAATRYRPSLISFGKQFNGQSSNKKLAGNSRWVVGSQGNYASSSNNQPRLPAFQGTASIAGLDDHPTSVFAHPHSAEQLERLVRAATRATGIQSPILPAIVSAPTGTFPGYYIPAIESESESQVNELRHGEPSTTSSKIPGTDYVLHPEEVRAMINIGELAWRKQQAREQVQNQESGQKGSRMNQQQQVEPGASEVRNWRFTGNGHLMPGGNLMQENHLENMRNFAYVDRNPRDTMQGSHSSMNSQQQRLHSRQNLNMSNQNELESQLSNHFRQNQLQSFPAIIRVNDQDYVHWPLIKFQAKNSQVNQPDGHQLQLTSMDESQRFAVNGGPFSAVGPFLPYPRGQLYTYAANPTQLNPSVAASAPQPSSGPQAQQHQAQEFRPNQGTDSKVQADLTDGRSNGRNPATDLEHSPVRFATQLSPSEIRQVEDSIIEALIATQALQHQRNLIENYAAQNQQSPMFAKPDNFWAGSGNVAHRLRVGLFGRRKRRNSSNPKASPGGQQQMLALPSGSHFTSMVPLLNVSGIPIHIVSPLMQYINDDVAFNAQAQTYKQDLVQTEPMLHESNELPPPRLPVVMADQETNKPILKESPETNLLTESTAPRASILAAPSRVIATERGRLSMIPDDDYDGRVTFGSRVTNGRERTQANQLRFDGSVGDRNLFIEEPAKHSNQKSSASNRVNKLDDSSDDNIGRQTGPLRNRINVDWPAMVSDADYFPPANEQRLATAAGRNTMTQIYNRENSHNMGGQRAQSRPGNLLKNYASSQLKLQFAQDYQAREGVPIYNNNVRVAGGLDRQRSEGSQARQLAPKNARLESSKVESNPSDDDDDADEADDEKSDDLQQRGTFERQVDQPISQPNPKTPWRYQASEPEAKLASRGPQFVTTSVSVGAQNAHSQNTKKV